MNGPSRVAVVRCPSYAREDVERAIDEGLRFLGGLPALLGERRRVLLKPNLLHGDDPARGSITHPAVLRAAAIACLKAGCEVNYGDSPAFHNPRTAVRLCGYEAVAGETGITLADFENGEERTYPDGKQNRVFKIARGALDAEAIVNLPKMKTHGLTRMTGAVKNMFGLVPGLTKSWLHARLPEERSFSRMLVDLNRFFTPALSIMDAVDGMEGNGPRNGRLVRTGLLILSADPVALDAVACRIMGIDPGEIYFLSYAESIGFGRIKERDIEMAGVPLSAAATRKYETHPPSAVVFSKSPFLKYLKRLLVPRPVIGAERCTRCGQCVRICPVEPKAITAVDGRQPRYDYDRCIRCYCCQETCPEGAIRIRVPALGVLFHGLKKRL
ncbi:MAG: DUF362 domain-containing protein [Spirochaetales bacterium]|nr:DUF362 domain-containing protein [Spirochaetales bacterium]